MSLWLHLLIAELRRSIFRLWSYRVDTLGKLALWLVAFPILMVIFASVAPNFDAQARAASLLGFLVWNLCIGALSSITEEVTVEARTGTLEAVLLSPVAPVNLFVLRTVTFLIVQGVQTIVLGLILGMILDVPLKVVSVTPVLLGLTLLGTVGVSLALGGVALIYKQTASLVSVVSLLALLATGALVPLNSLQGVFLLLKWFVPTAWGIDALRNATLYGATWQTLLADNTLVGLVIQSAVFLALGFVTFRRSFKRARQQGTLGEY